MKHTNIRKYRMFIFLVILGFGILLGYTNCDQPLQNRSVTVGNPVDPDPSPIEGPPNNCFDSLHCFTTGDLLELLSHICAHQFYTGHSRNFNQCLEEISSDQALANDITQTINTFSMQELLGQAPQLPYLQTFGECNLTLYYEWSSLPVPTSFAPTNYNSSIAIQLLENITGSNGTICRDIFNYSLL